MNTTYNRVFEAIGSYSCLSGGAELICKIFYFIHLASYISPALLSLFGNKAGSPTLDLDNNKSVPETTCKVAKIGVKLHYVDAHKDNAKNIHDICA